MFECCTFLKQKTTVFQKEIFINNHKMYLYVIVYVYERKHDAVITHTFQICNPDLIRRITDFESKRYVLLLFTYLFIIFIKDTICPFVIYGCQIYSLCYFGAVVARLNILMLRCSWAVFGVYASCNFVMYFIWINICFLINIWLQILI